MGVAPEDTIERARREDPDYAEKLHKYVQCLNDNDLPSYVDENGDAVYRKSVLLSDEQTKSEQMCR